MPLCERSSAKLCVALSSLLAGMFSGSTVGQELLPLRPEAAVYIHVSARDDLPGTAFTALRTEATRIWARHRIMLAWGRDRPPSTDLRYAAVIPVIFDDREMAKLPAHRDDDALARAVFIGRRQTIYVSVSRALQMVRRLHAVGTELHDQGTRDVRTGTFLGRVVAHELGHILLTSRAHATTGLMRPTFVFGDLASGDDASIELTAGDADRLAMRFSLPALTPATVLAQRPALR
jgi:hypothetical protein